MSVKYQPPDYSYSIFCVFLKVIKERAKFMSSEPDSDSDQGPRKRQAFLDMLLKTTCEDGQNLSHEDIQEEVDTFMFEVQIKLQKETL